MKPIEKEIRKVYEKDYSMSKQEIFMLTLKLARKALKKRFKVTKELGKIYNPDRIHQIIDEVLG